MLLEINAQLLDCSLSGLTIQVESWRLSSLPSAPFWYSICLIIFNPDSRVEMHAPHRELSIELNKRPGTFGWPILPV